MENSTAHASPIQSWKLIAPSVVSALKSGAVSPMVSGMVVLLVAGGGHGGRGRVAAQWGKLPQLSCQ
jgi:hypothetical protein